MSFEPFWQAYQATVQICSMQIIYSYLATSQISSYDGVKGLINLIWPNVQCPPKNSSVSILIVCSIFGWVFYWAVVFPKTAWWVKICLYTSAFISLLTLIISPTAELEMHPQAWRKLSLCFNLQTGIRVLLISSSFDIIGTHCFLKHSASGYHARLCVFLCSTTSYVLP